jgi:hypothetical protein
MMNKLVLTMLVMSILIDPVLSANNASKNVIDVARGGHGGALFEKNRGSNPYTDPTLNSWIP